MDREPLRTCSDELLQLGRLKLLAFEKLEPFSQHARFDGDGAQPVRHLIHPARER